jgi:predicted dehydrogenase
VELVDAQTERVVMIRTLIIGYGYWGSVIARNVQEHPDFFISAVHDPSEERLLAAAGQNIHAYKYLDEAIDKTHPELVCVCTPISEIAPTTFRVLTRYMSVMACKPGATSLAEYEQILETADKYHRSYTIDYTTLAAPSFARLRERLIGHRILSVEASRCATMQRSSADIIDDLVVHDAAMIAELVDTTEVDFVKAERSETRADIEFRAGDVRVRLVADRAANSTVRVLRIVTDKAIITYDQAAEDEEPTPVMARLDWLTSRLRGASLERDNRDVARRVLQLTDRIKEEAR